nr:hypothetical protein Iba_chr10bCG2220 [Ipomoea batatas]
MQRAEDEMGVFMPKPDSTAKLGSNRSHLRESEREIRWFEQSNMFFCAISYGSKILRRIEVTNRGSDDSQQVKGSVLVAPSHQSLSSLNSYLRKGKSKRTTHFEQGDKKRRRAKVERNNGCIVLPIALLPSILLALSKHHEVGPATDFSIMFLIDLLPSFVIGIAWVLSLTTLDLVRDWGSDRQFFSVIGKRPLGEVEVEDTLEGPCQTKHRAIHAVSLYAMKGRRISGRDGHCSFRPPHPDDNTLVLLSTLCPLRSCSTLFTLFPDDPRDIKDARRGGWLGYAQGKNGDATKACIGTLEAAFPDDGRGPCCATRDLTPSWVFLRVLGRLPFLCHHDYRTLFKYLPLFMT